MPSKSAQVVLRKGTYSKKQIAACPYSVGCGKFSLRRWDGWGNPLWRSGCKHTSSLYLQGFQNRCRPWWQLLSTPASGWGLKESFQGLAVEVSRQKQSMVRGNGNLINLAAVVTSATLYRCSRIFNTKHCQNWFSWTSPTPLSFEPSSLVCYKPRCWEYWLPFHLNCHLRRSCRVLLWAMPRSSWTFWNP